jgi:hypothetical protein
MKTKVICDTGVWYRLAIKGLIPELQNCELYITNLSIFELCSTENLEKYGLNSVKEAFIAIQKYAPKNILSPNPIQQIILTYNPKYIDELAYRQNSNIIKLFTTFLSAKSIADIDYDYLEQIKFRKEATEIWIVNDIQPYIEKLTKEGINEFKSIDEYVRYFLIYRIKEYLRMYSPLTLFDPNKDLRKLDIFFNCFAFYIQDVVKKNIKGQVTKIKKNDLVDFMNLIYCGDDFKYLTTETKNRGVNLALLSKAANYLLPDNKAIQDKLNSD